MEKGKIIEGILENLSFETLADYKQDTYNIECKQSVSTLDITISNKDNDSEFTVAYANIGKMKDKDVYMVKVNHKKNFWYKEYSTLGTMVDSIDDIISFIKSCCMTIIKEM